MDSTKNSEENLPRFIAQPERADIWLMVALFGMALYSFAMIPLRAWLLSQPLLYSLLVGGYTSAVVSGANASIDNGHWLVYLLCGLVGALKFVPIYWAMGKRWGKEFIEMSLQYMPRFKNIFEKAIGSESGTAKSWTLGLMPLAFAPGPVPYTILAAVAGMLKVTVWTVLGISAVSVLVVNGTMMWLGFTYGEIVLEIVSVINRYLLWITLGLLALMFARAWRQSKKASRQAENPEREKATLDELE